MFNWRCRPAAKSARGDLKIHLGVDADFRPARKAHVALLVNDLPELQAKLEASGYTLKDDEPLEGHRRVYVDDPFGNRVELMEIDSLPVINIHNAGG
jgi:catechol 2,3-dioxygenase-like lactoylglutathione lyase family enzyme